MEYLLEMLDVIMPKPNGQGTGKHAAVINTGMAQAIRNDEVPPSCQGGNNTGVGQIAAAEGQCRGLKFQLGYFLFQKVVDFEIAAH